MEDIEIKKYMDRAIRECDSKTLDLIEKLPPRIAVYMLLKMGEELCVDDEWQLITKQLKPKWWEFWKLR